MARGILSGIGLGAVFSVGVASVVSVVVPIEPQQGSKIGDVQSGAPSEQAAAAEPTVTELPLVPEGSDSPEQETAATNDTAMAKAEPEQSLVAATEKFLAEEADKLVANTSVSEVTQETKAPDVVAPDVTSDLAETLAEAPETPAPLTQPNFQTVTLAPEPSPLTLSGPADSDDGPALPSPLPAQPATGNETGLTTPRPLPEAVAISVEEDTPVLPIPQALAPMIPEGDVTQQPIVPFDEAREEEEAVSTPASAPDSENAPAPEAETEAKVEDGNANVVAAAPKPRVLQTPGTKVGTLGSTSRLRVGTPASTLINRSETVATTAIETATQISDDSGQQSPLRRFAQPFENPEGKPLMSIVLMDTGVDLDAAEIGLPALSSFPYPVSFAVDARLVDAAKRMERYRAEGFDVLAMLDLPQGAQPSDAEVSLSVTLNGLPEIVGVLEGTGEGLQISRAVADQVTGILKASGHGLVTQNKGLNSMPKLAVKEGVPAAPVFRDFDSAGQQARVIRRFLDQAAFKAGQEGGVIMLGRLRPETIEALLIWGLADRAGTVALAPVSAVLLSRR